MCNNPEERSSWVTLLSASFRMRWIDFYKNFLIMNMIHVCTVHQQYQDTILLLQTDAHNYKIIGILKQLKFRISLRHVSVHAGTIFRELSRA